MEKFNLNDLINKQPIPGATVSGTTSSGATPQTSTGSTAPEAAAPSTEAKTPRLIQGRAVTEEEKNGYKAMKAQGLSIKKIAEHYKRQPAVVYGHLKKMGLTNSAGKTNVQNAAAAEGIKLQSTSPTSGPTPPSQPAAAPQVPPVQVNKPKNLLDLLGGNK